MPCCSRVGIAVAARECSSIAHSVLHCHPALLQIPVLIHLVHGVGIKVILKRVAVEYLVKQSLYLVAVLADIISRLRTFKVFDLVPGVRYVLRLAILRARVFIASQFSGCIRIGIAAGA